MTLTVNPWWVIAVLSLALFGMVFVWRVARHAARDLWAWLRRDRVGPLLEDEPGCGCCEAGCCYGIDPGECGQCEHPESWHTTGLYCYPECPPDCNCSRLELPPERSAEALGFTGPPPESAELRQWRRDEARRERLASAAELEHRAAYEACGFEFPSGLLARVRELAR